jgi:hypothetical protein
MLVSPEDRDADGWLRTVEKIARAAAVHQRVMCSSRIAFAVIARHSRSKNGVASLACASQ